MTPTHKGMIVWFTGLSGAGKSTLARGVHDALRALHPSLPLELLDSDKVRVHLARGLGFSREDREENIRRLGYVSTLLSRHGVIVLAAAISPYRAGRDEIRQSGSFLEVFADAPLAVCQERDPVGLYRRFNAGEIQNLSGLDAPYEPPLQPEVHCRTATESLEVSVARVVDAIQLRLA